VNQFLTPTVTDSGSYVELLKLDPKPSAPDIQFRLPFIIKIYGRSCFSFLTQFHVSKNFRAHATQKTTIKTPLWSASKRSSASF
jgi:hypothetical protein